MLNLPFLDEKLRGWLKEDLSHVDVDTSERPNVRAHVLAEDDGVMCGGPALIRILQLLAARPGQVQAEQVDEGGIFGRGEPIVSLDVHPEVLRHGIRVGLNLVQRLSGIAANTRRMMRELDGTGCTLLDTRKTTPGFTVFEKYAVRVGGGKNHRHGRYDGILIKKEDIVIDGGITAAVRQAATSVAFLTGIEVEVETQAQLEEVMTLPEVTHVLLDNMDVAGIVVALRTVKGRKIVEASGVPHDRLRAYAETGVKYISTSALLRDAGFIKMKMRIV